MSNFEKKYDGVMAIITNSAVTDVLLIQELTRSERTGKDIGDYAFPAESRDPSEKDPLVTAARIFQEEIRVLDAQLRTFLCSLDINDLTVSVMHFIADPSNEVSIGTAQNEVANPRWVPIDQVRSGSLQVRQGVQEVISAMGSNRLKSDTVLKTTPRFTKKKSSDPRS